MSAGLVCASARRRSPLVSPGTLPAMGQPNRAELKEAAHAFIADAFEVLTEEHVLPTPRYHPYIRVGRDYEGPSLMFLPAYERLEELLDAAYPERFSEPLSPDPPLRLAVRGCP